MTVAPARSRTNGSPRPVRRADPMPPNDLDAEAAVLSAVMLDGSRLTGVRGIISAEDFYSAAHRHVFRALCGLADRGSKLDAVLLKGELDRVGRLAEVGGLPALADLTDCTPAIANVADHARIVAEHARARRELEAAQRLVAGIRTGDREQASLARAELAAAHPADAAPLPELSPSGIVAAWRTEGRLVRVPTGIEPLDRMCRGGLPVPWRVILVGAPSAGKTALAVVIAYMLASACFDAGLCVGILAVDEEKMKASDGPFGSLWEWARSALTQAREVHIVGRSEPGIGPSARPAVACTAKSRRRGCPARRRGVSAFLGGT